MPDEPTTDTDGDLGENPTIQQMREALNRERERRTAAEAEATTGRAASRQLAFHSAGIDLESRVGQLVAHSYDGELETEAIRAFAADIPGAMRGETPPPAGNGTQPPPDDGPTAAEQAAAAAAATLETGGVPAGAVPEKPLGIDMMDAAYAAQGGNVRARPAGGMSDRATASGLQVLLNRAVAGDDEAVYKHADESWSDAKARFDRR